MNETGSISKRHTGFFATVRASAVIPLPKGCGSPRANGLYTAYWRPSRIVAICWGEFSRACGAAARARDRIARRQIATM